MKNLINNKEYQENMNKYYSLIEPYKNNPEGTPENISKRAKSFIDKAMDAIKGICTKKSKKSNARRISLNKAIEKQNRK